MMMTLLASLVLPVPPDGPEAHVDGSQEAVQ